MNPALILLLIVLSGYVPDANTPTSRQAPEVIAAQAIARAVDDRRECVTDAECLAQCEREGAPDDDCEEMFRGDHDHAQE